MWETRRVQLRFNARVDPDDFTGRSFRRVSRCTTWCDDDYYTRAVRDSTAYTFEVRRERFEMSSTRANLNTTTTTRYTKLRSHAVRGDAKIEVYMRSWRRERTSETQPYRARRVRFETLLSRRYAIIQRIREANAIAISAGSSDENSRWRGAARAEIFRRSRDCRWHPRDISRIYHIYTRHTWKKYIA